METPTNSYEETPKPVEMGFLEEDIAEITDATAVNPEDIAVSRIFVKEAMERVYPGHRDIIQGLVEGSNLQEIADERGISSGATRDKAHRAFRELKDWIEHGEELEKDEEK